MSLRLQTLGPVPDCTAAIVRSVYKKGHPYLAFAEVFADLVDYDDFSELYPNLGQSAIHPARLALALLVGVAEGLSDRQIAEKVKDSILWKYLLRLEIEYDGFDHTVLSKFRDRLLAHGSERLIFDKLVSLASDRGLLGTEKQRTDSTHILSKARKLNRLELVFETMRACLDDLADADSDWVKTIAQSEWLKRYFEERPFNYKLKDTDNARDERIKAVGSDGFYLLKQIDTSGDEVAKRKSVMTLRTVWAQQFDNTGRGGPKFKSDDELEKHSELIATPHDTEARVTKKRTRVHLGYKSHVTETFTAGFPHLITDITTTPATTYDSEMLKPIQTSLAARGMRPKEHLVDMGYTKADEMADSLEQHSTEIIGQLRSGKGWQYKKEGAFTTEHFVVDFENRKITCPMGATAGSWRYDRKEKTFRASFSIKDCGKCPSRQLCTNGENPRRTISIKTKPTFEYMQKQRKYQQTEEFWRRYAPRAGIESTISQAVNNTRLRRCSYVGLAKAQLEHLLIAAGINFLRLGSWLSGAPITTTRQTPYQCLMAVA